MGKLEFQVSILTVNVLLFLCDITYASGVTEYACGVTEYEFGGKCCSMCGPGTHVVEHCSENTNTSCAPCNAETFIDRHSNFMRCFPCAVCDPGLHLKIDKACNSTSNTVCGPLDQHFCTDENKGCRTAERHTNCKPGQFIMRKGTTSTDTLCEDCPQNTFSDGLSTYCKQHRDCKSEGLFEVKRGNHSSDSECGEKSTNGLWIVALLLGIFLFLAATGAIVFLICKKGVKPSSKGEPAGHSFIHVGQKDRRKCNYDRVEQGGTPTIWIIRNIQKRLQ